MCVLLYSNIYIYYGKRINRMNGKIIIWVGEIHESSLMDIANRVMKLFIEEEK